MLIVVDSSVTSSEFFTSVKKKEKVFVWDFKSPDDIDSLESCLKYWNASQLTISQKKKIIEAIEKRKWLSLEQY